MFNGDEIPTAVKYHKNLQDVCDVCLCVCQKFVERALMILGCFYFFTLEFGASTGCLVGEARALSEGTTGLWL